MLYESKISSASKENVFGGINFVESSRGVFRNQLNICDGCICWPADLDCIFFENFPVFFEDGFYSFHFKFLFYQFYFIFFNSDVFLFHAFFATNISSVHSLLFSLWYIYIYIYVNTVSVVLIRILVPLNQYERFDIYLCFVRQHNFSFHTLRPLSKNMGNMHSILAN